MTERKLWLQVARTAIRVPVSLTLAEMLDPVVSYKTNRARRGAAFFHPRGNKRSESPNSASRALSFCGVRSLSGCDFDDGLRGQGAAI